MWWESLYILNRLVIILYHYLYQIIIILSIWIKKKGFFLCGAMVQNSMEVLIGLNYNIGCRLSWRLKSWQYEIDDFSIHFYFWHIWWSVVALATTLYGPQITQKYLKKNYINIKSSPKLHYFHEFDQLNECFQSSWPTFKKSST